MLLNDNISISMENLKEARLFGSLEKSHGKYNLLALITRYYIYVSRMNNQVKSEVNEWRQYLKFKLKITILSLPKGLIRETFRTEYLDWL